MRRPARAGLLLLLAGILHAVPYVHAEPELPPLDDARVTLPYGELLRLVDETRAPRTKTPPVRAALLHAEYRLSLAGNADAPAALRIGATFVAENFTEEDVLLPILPGNLAAQADEMQAGDGQAGSLIRHEGQLALLLRNAGRRTTRISFSPKEWMERHSGWEVRFPGLPAASRSLHVGSVPHGWTLDVPGASILSNAEEMEQGTWRFQLPPEQATIRLLASREEQATGKGAWSVRSEIFAERKPGHLQFTAQISAWPEEENPRELVLRLPEAVRQIEVAALPGHEEEWTTEIRMHTPEQVEVARREVVIRRAPGAEGEWQFGLRYQTPLDALAETWVLLGPETGENGNVFLLPQPAGVELVMAGSSPETELPAPDPSALPDWLEEKLASRKTAGGTGRVRVFRGGPEIPLRASYLPKVELDDLTLVQLSLSTRLARDGALFSEATYEIEHRAAQPFVFALPQDSQLVGASLQGRPVQVLRRDKEYEVPLPAAPTGQCSASKLQVSYTGRLAAFDPVSGGFSLALHHGRYFTRQFRWTIRLPETYEAAGIESNAEVKAAAEPGAILLERSFAAGSAPAVEASVFYRRRGLAQSR